MSKIKLSYPTKKRSLSVTELSGTLAHITSGRLPFAGLARHRAVACGGDGIRLALLARWLLRLKENESELITSSLEEYEALALRLAREPGYLCSIREKLARNRDTYPLFDSPRFTRHIEAAYTTMWERQQSGLPPQAFAVDPIDFA